MGYDLPLIKPKLDTLEDLSGRVFTGLLSSTDPMLTFVCTPDTKEYTLTITHSSTVVVLSGQKYIISSLYIDNFDFTGYGYGKSYYYYEFNGNTAIITRSTTIPDINIYALIAIVVYNDTIVDDTFTPKAFCLDERHTVAISPTTHSLFHKQQGAQIYAGGTLEAGTYTVSTANTTTAQNQFGITAVTDAADEDITFAFGALTEATGYTIVWKDSSHNWFWKCNNTTPYAITGTRIDYNGVAGLVEINNTNDLYVNYYLTSFINATDPLFNWVNFPQQVVPYTSLSTAQAEKVSQLDLTGMPSAEYVFRYQITYRHRSNYAQSGQVRIEAEPVLVVGTKLAITSGVNTASQIAFIPDTNVTSTNVQDAITEVASSISIVTSTKPVGAILYINDNYGGF